MTVKMMHSGDWHLDTAHHGRINPQTGIDTVIESNAEVASYLVDEAIQKGADLFLLPGDVVSAGRPSTETLMMLADILKPLVDAKIPIELDEGNHERLSVPAKHRTVSDVLGRMLGGPESIHVVTDLALKHYDKVDVLTVPYPSKSRILSMLGHQRVDPVKGDGIVVRYIMDECERILENRDTSIPLVITGHFTVTGIGLPGSEQDIANLMNEVVFPLEGFEKFDPAYIALAHIHTPQQVGDLAYYCGSPNKLTFTDANDIKGGNFVTLDNKNRAKVQRILTPVRGMYKVDLENEEFDLDLEENDVVQVYLREGENELSKELRKAAAQAGASLIPKTRPVRKAAVKRTVLPEKISPLSALKTHLKEQGIDEKQIKELLNKAKTLGAKGDDQ